MFQSTNMTNGSVGSAAATWLLRFTVLLWYFHVHKYSPFWIPCVCVCVCVVGVRCVCVGGGGGVSKLIHIMHLFSMLAAGSFPPALSLLCGCPWKWGRDQLTWPEETYEVQRERETQPWHTLLTCCLAAWSMSSALVWMLLFFLTAPLRWR